MKPRRPNESDADYIRRLEDANASLRAENQRIKEWTGRVNEAVTVLSTEGSLAFQRMADLAGVRSHPSVTAVVELLDKISHPQWRNGEALPKIEWPTDWRFDDDEAWSGDADMGLNAAIAAALDFFEHASFGSMKQAQREAMSKIANDLSDVTRRGVEGIKDHSGFRPKHMTPPVGSLQSLSPDQLRDLVSTMGWMALDLAQDMHFGNFMLRRDLRAATYRRVCGDLYRLSQFDFDRAEEDTKFSIKIFGAEDTPL